jgi:predicted GNAT family acetyltransferase
LGAACVAALTRKILSQGHRCALFASLGDPTANAVYRRTGYKPVAEFMTIKLGHG